MYKARLLLGFTLVLSVANAYTANWPDFPFVFVEGKAEMNLPPDRATVTFSVKAFEKDPELALKAVHERGLEIASMLQAAGIDEKDIEAYQLDKQAVRAKRDYTELEILGYEVTQQFEIKISDIKKYTLIIGKLVALQNVTELDTDFDVANRKSIESDLVKEASADARARANALAAGLGAKVESTFGISEQHFMIFAARFGIHESFAQSRVMMNGHQNIFIPATIKIEKTINVVFRLTSSE